MNYYSFHKHHDNILPPHKQLPQITLFGCFPEKGNCGDEATYISLFQLFERLQAQCNVSVISSLPPQELWNFVNIQHLNESSLKELNEQTTCSLVIGGGVINRLDCCVARHMPVYHQTIDKPFYYLSTAVDTNCQYNNNDFEFITSAILKAKYYSTRSQQERAFLQNHFPQSKFEYTSDVIYWLQSKAAHIHFPHETMVGFSLRTCQPDMIPYFANMADAIIKKHNAVICFLPFSFFHDPDPAFALKVQDHMKHKDRVIVIQSYQHPCLLQDIMGQMKFIVAMRLHAGVLAQNVNVPFVSIAYHSKIKNWLNDLKREDLILFDAKPNVNDNEYNFSFDVPSLPNTDTLLDKIDNALNNPISQEVTDAQRHLFLNHLLKILDENEIAYNKPSNTL